MPILVGLILRWEGAAGMLMIGTIAGILLANVLNNGGGAWDNAKKMIEAGLLRTPTATCSVRARTSTLPQSSATPSAIHGRTLPDPSIHVLIKLMATITLVMASLFI